MPARTGLRTFAGTTPEPDVLLSFHRDISVNRLSAPLAGQADLRVGGLQGSDSVSTRHPPLKPLPDPIPLKIQFPSSKPCSSPQRAASPSGLEEAGQPQIPADADEKAAELVAERAPRFAKDEGITDQRSSAPRRPHPSNTAAAQSQTGAPVRKPDPPGHLI